jgi:hypothetical protein
MVSKKEEVRMKRIVKLGSAVLVACAAAVVVAGEIKSGLQVGDGPPPFDVRNVTGSSCADFAKDERGSLCYRCKFSAFPTTAVFARTVDDNLTTLVKQLDATVGKDESKKLRAFVVLLTEDADAAAKQLEKLAQKEGIKNVPLTLVEGPAGPPEYKIAKEADITVLGWNGPVKFNHAFKKGEIAKKDIESIVTDVQKLAADK